MHRTPVSDAVNQIDQNVRVSGYVHEFRNLGKIRFIILRDQSGTIQVVTRDKIDLNREDVIDVIGKVVRSNIAKAGVEIQAESIRVISRVKKKLPVDPSGIIPSDLDTRIKYRFLDLRKPEVMEIFKTKSDLINSYRQALLKRGFIEIHPSLILGAASEGGAEVFQVEYFERKAYLAQSPQLYKQMVVIGGLERVFITLPIYRAEKHNTIYHLNEAMSLDVEMAHIDSHYDVIELLRDVVIEMIGNKIGLRNINVYSYEHVVELLNENNMKIELGDDFSKDHERKIYEILGEEMYFIEGFPTKIRAFYTMPKDDMYSRSFDLFFRGLEIASGAQRIHDVDMLENALLERNLRLEDFDFYLEAFRYGAPTHGGFGMGLERFVMQLLRLNNIREAVLFPRDRTRLLP
ncbi:MAG: aspartate--tRNA(Asn) ligase [Candidatus Micrarchaeota archaeon]|nr:aspartate--tRNA(Asn) ligase [Candidatus Micrarchaeota archaeon]